MRFAAVFPRPPEPSRAERGSSRLVGGEGKSTEAQQERKKRLSRRWTWTSASGSSASDRR